MRPRRGSSTRRDRLVTLSCTMGSPARALLTIVSFATALSLVVPAGAGATSRDGNSPGRAARVSSRDAGTAKPAYNGRPRAKVPIAFARVVLDEQMTYVYNGRGRLVATIPSSTGLHDWTPTGTFRVFSKSAQTYYTPNPSERMKWMVRFTKGRNGGNIGFHGIPYTVVDGREVPFPTPLGEEPSSHGCIRLAVTDAKWLFENMAVGATVSVVRSRG